MRGLRRSRGALVVAGLLLASIEGASAQGRTPPPAAVNASRVDSTSYASLRWRHIGPEGNRVTSVSGVVGDRTTYYAGSASGGLWKTADGGNTWRAIFDDQPVSSIGSV